MDRLAVSIRVVYPLWAHGFVIALSSAILVSLILHKRFELPMVNYLNRKLVRREARGVPV